MKKIAKLFLLVLNFFWMVYPCIAADFEGDGKNSQIRHKQQRRQREETSDDAQGRYKKSSRTEYNRSPIGTDKVGSRAEWDHAKTILVHRPGHEQFLGILHPPAALFEGVFDLNVAGEQHDGFVSLLRKNGVKVYNIKEVLLSSTLEELRNFTSQFLTYYSDTSQSHEQEEKRLEVLKKLSQEDFVNILLLNPSIHLERTVYNTGFKAKYELSPLMNLMFLRDQMITTNKGVVLGNMNSPQRSKEPKIIKFVLKKLGIDPLYEVNGTGRLEGGDYLPAGDTAFIGQGLRTNEKAIQELLENKVFGTRRVIVVKDTWQNQQEMHLDTYFNIINEDSVVLSEWRSSGQKENTSYVTYVDEYELINCAYQLKQKNKIFFEYLKKYFKNIILVSEEDQLRYGINFLTIAPNKILAIDGVSKKYKMALKKVGVDVTWMNFSALTQAYGAAHCLTQVIGRAANMNRVQEVEDDL